MKLAYHTLLFLSKQLVNTCNTYSCYHNVNIIFTRSNRNKSIYITTYTSRFTSIHITTGREAFDFSIQFYTRRHYLLSFPSAVRIHIELRGVEINNTHTNKPHKLYTVSNSHQIVFIEERDSEFILVSSIPFESLCSDRDSYLLSFLEKYITRYSQPGHKSEVRIKKKAF
jgi:hypothetical protein